MKTLRLSLFIGFLTLISTSTNAQTTFKIDSINIDSGIVSPTYCTGQNSMFISVPIALTGYTSGDSVEITINYGDGLSDVQNFPIWNSVSNYCVGYFNHTYNTPGIYKILIDALAPDAKTDQYLSKNSINVISCGTISGSVFFDLNNNCVKDNGEQPAFWTSVKIVDNSTQAVYYGYTNSTGYYSTLVPTGATYSINILSTQFSQLCPTSGYANVTAPANSKDFGVVCGSGFDLSGQVWGGFRPGFNRTIAAKVYNSTCNAKSGRFRLILSDPRITYSYSFSSTPAPTVSGDTLSWNFSNINYSSRYSWNVGRYYIKVMTDSTAQLGDTICIDMIVEPITGDNDPSNNIKTFCLPVNNSVDPNDKVGLPIGFGPDKIIERGQSLDYTIRFQNTGNDTAYKVVLLDTLPEELDLASLVINGSSHPFNFYIVDERTLKFEFLDIDLPDSTTNEALSHGSVNFSIDQKSNLPYGTVIENTAYIYFDFNDAVVTNTDHHRVDIINSVSVIESPAFGINIFPNPANDKLYLDILSSDQTTVRLYNVLGAVLFNETFSEGLHVIDVNHLKNGVYIVEATTIEDRITEKLIIQK